MTSRRTDCYRVHQVTVTPTATTPVQLTERQRWDYRNRDETWSIFLTRDTVIPHPTADTRFEDFVERLQLAVHTVLAESEHDRLGVVHGVGLRYIDVARASGGKDFRFYLRIPTIPITRSGKPITDSGGFRSPWRRAEVHRGAGVGLRV